LRKFKTFRAGILATCLVISPALAAITLHSNGISSPVVNQPTVTLSTVGDSLIVACASADQGQGNSQTVSDNRGNTWTRVASPQRLGSTQIELWYALVTSANASTAVQYSGNFSDLAVATFAGTATSSVTDGAATGATSGFSTSIQPGSITPSQANGLLAACWGADPTTGTLAINGSFTITNSSITGGNTAVGLGYLIQTTATAANPTWSGYTITSSLAAMQAFKDPGGGGGTTGGANPTVISVSSP